MYKIITEADREDTASLSAFVRLHQNGHFLQAPQWAQVKQCWNWRGVVVYDPRNEIIGALSILIRPLPLGLSLLYAPRGPVCDRDNKAVLMELLEGVQDIAKSSHALLFCLDPDESDDNAAFRSTMKACGFIEKSSSGFDNIQPQHVFRLEIANRSEKEIFGNFSSKTRYNIRLALRRQVKIKQFYGNEAIPEDVFGSFSNLMKVTGKRDGFTVRDAAYFEKLFASLGKAAVLFLAYWRGRPIAGTIGIFYGSKAWYLYGASSNEHRSTMPNYLLQWEMIRHAVSCGCSIYDLRGVPGDLSEANPLYGLYRFKKGFHGDYVKFTGLFIYPYRKKMSWAFFRLLRYYRRIRSFFNLC